MRRTGSFCKIFFFYLLTMRFARGQRKMASTLHKCLENTIQHKKERSCERTEKGNCERKSSFCKIECNFVAFDFLMATTERKLKLLSCVLCVCVVWEFMYLLVLVCVRVCVCYLHSTHQFVVLHFAVVHMAVH